MRWKGFVETSGWGGGGRATEGAGAGAGGGAAAEDASEDCDIILKKGLRLSVSVGGLDVTICGTEATVAGGGVGCGGVGCGGVGFRSGSWWTIWLSPSVGVDA
jgi:hypothetical protein